MSPRAKPTVPSRDDRYPSSLPNFHTAPGHLFRRGRQFHDALWASYVDVNLTPLQYAVLTALALEPEIDQRTLGERVALDKSTIGDILARLGKRGLIKRKRDRFDGRRRVVEVTPDGRLMLTHVAPLVARIGAEIMNVLDPDEQAEFVRLINKIVYSREALQLSPAGDLTMPRAPAAQVNGNAS